MEDASELDVSPDSVGETPICWLLVIYDDIVEKIELFATRESALRELFLFVRDRWEGVFGEEPIEGDPRRAIERYFDACDAGYDLEDRALL